jgi:hypothetical protein
MNKMYYHARRRNNEFICQLLKEKNVRHSRRRRRRYCCCRDLVKRTGLLKNQRLAPSRRVLLIIIYMYEPLYLLIIN